MQLQAVRFEASAVPGTNLWRQVREVFFQLAEVVEVLAIPTPFRLGGCPGACGYAGRASFEGGHVALPASADELVLLARLDRAVAFAALVLLARYGHGFRLKVGHTNTSPAAHRQGSMV